MCWLQALAYALLSSALVLVSHVLLMHVSKPFASILENPSWSIASSLPPLLPANAAHPSRTRIVVHPFPVAVSYKAVHDLIPAVFATGPRADVILHIGVSEFRDHYSLERTARRDGYIRLDTTGELAKGVEPAYWGDCPAELQTHIRMEDVLKRWQSVVPVSCRIPPCGMQIQ